MTWLQYRVTSSRTVGELGGSARYLSSGKRTSTSEMRTSALIGLVTPRVPARGRPGGIVIGRVGLCSTVFYGFPSPFT